MVKKKNCRKKKTKRFRAACPAGDAKHFSTTVVGYNLFHLVNLCYRTTSFRFLSESRIALPYGDVLVIFFNSHFLIGLYFIKTCVRDPVTSNKCEMGITLTYRMMYCTTCGTCFYLVIYVFIEPKMFPDITPCTHIPGKKARSRCETL